MHIESLPYDILAYITTFLHPLDLVDFSLTSAYIQSCCRHALAIHQQKLISLSTIKDTNRLRSLEIVRNTIFPKVENDDVWYHRRIMFLHLQPVDTSDLGLALDDILSEKERILYEKALRDHVRFLNPHWAAGMLRGNVDGLLLFAACKMPRLSSVYFVLHQADTGGVLLGMPPGSPVLLRRNLSLLLLLIRALLRTGDEPLWPPGLWSLQSVEIDLGHLLTSEALRTGADFPVKLYWQDIETLLQLPNLTKLTISRQPDCAVLQCVCDRIHMEHTHGRHCTSRSPNQESSLQELHLSRLGMASPAIEKMVSLMKGLRVLVCDDRGDTRQIPGLIQLLAGRHSNSLETLQLPPYLGSMLPFLKGFEHLRHVSLSYLDIMATLMRNEHDSQDLAHFLPDSLRFLQLLGGRVYISGGNAALMPSDTSIEHFISYMSRYIRQKSTSTNCCLTDVCFGDMRVQAIPDCPSIGRAYHRDMTAEREVVRMKLNRALMSSTSLRDASSPQDRVHLHFATFESNLKECSHPGNHLYKPTKRPTKEELRKQAEDLSKDADPKVQETLAQVVSKLSERGACC